MHNAIIASMGIFAPFFAFHGGYMLFKAMQRLSPDSGVPMIAGVNAVILATIFPWLVIDDFVSAESSSLFFHCMLVGTLLVTMIEVLAPKKQKATNAPRAL